MQPKTIQLQPKAANLDAVSLMAQKISASKPTSSFTMPTNHVLPAWSFPTTGCSVPNLALSQFAPQGLSRAPSTNSDNNTTVPQVAPVTSGGTVYYLNPSSGPNLVVGAISINASSKAPISIGGPAVVPTVSIATTRTKPTAFTVQDLAKLLASSKNHLPEWKLAQYKGDSVQWQEWFGQFKSAND